MPNISYTGVCPFWKSESSDGTRMRCEICTFKFPDREARRDIAYKYCANDYKRCSIYPAAWAAAERAYEKRR